MENEIWKPIKGFEGYEVSNYGNVKSIKFNKEKILKPHIDRGYKHVKICKNSKAYCFPVHKLVAIVFLNNKPCGHKLVVNHKDFNRVNNNVNNLEIVTQRENANRKHLKHSSIYTGVSFNKKSKKWMSRIAINGKDKHLGIFINEIDAHNAYQKALNQLVNDLKRLMNEKA